MIHFLTVHHQEPRWLPLQRRALEKYVHGPYRVWAAVSPEIRPPAYPHWNFIPMAARQGWGLWRHLSCWWPPFRYRYGCSMDHAVKLNRLVKAVAAVGRPEDRLIFLDGDAFPIASMDVVDDLLVRAPLVAVQRTENGGDVQPHPAFCATTLGHWQAMKLDWRPHPLWGWRNAQGEWISDTGSRLLRALNGRWLPLHRTLSMGSHPVFFGVYGGLIYHQGAGFRPTISRAPHQRTSAQVSAEWEAKWAFWREELAVTDQ